MINITPFHVGQKVSIDLEVIKASNRWCKTPGYPNSRFIKQLESLVQEHGPVGTVSQTYEPGYDLCVNVGDYPVGFHMKGHSWCHPLPEADHA